MKRVRVLVVMAVMGAAILGAEGAVRWIEPGLSSAGAWPDGPLASQFDALSIRADDGPVDVVFAGSSMMHRAVDAKSFSERTRTSSFNASLAASTNTMLGPWLMDVVVPALRPKAVVIGVASRDFNDNADGPERTLRVLTGSPGYRIRTADDWLTRLDRALSGYSALIRSRRSLRFPTNVLDAAGRRRPPAPPRSCPRPAELERYRFNPTVARYPRTLLNDYAAGGVQLRALVGTIEALQRQRIDVVLVKLPASREYPDLHPNGTRDIDAFDDALAEVVRRTDVDVWDGSDLTSTKYFRDAIHLNCAGAQRFTSELADAGIVDVT
jgi:hypothetical protein